MRLVEAGESVLVTDRGTVVAAHDPSLYAPRPAALDPGAVRELLNAERGQRGGREERAG